MWFGDLEDEQMTKINEIWHVVSTRPGRMLYSVGVVCLLYNDIVGFWVGKKKGEGPFQQEYFLV